MLFLKFISVSVRSQMQYPTSFLMLSAGHFLSTFVDIFGVWVLFDRFKMVKGWTFYEIGLIYGTVQMGFALAEAFARGFDMFSHMVKKGEFDRLLLRPISPLFQVAVQEVQLMRVGRFLQGLCILLWCLHQLAIGLFSWSMLVIGFSILGTAALFYALFVIQATFCFWTIEALELMNITTYGGLQTGQYPMSIYKNSLRWIFTFLIPLACVGYYPIVAVLKSEPSALYWFSLAAPISGFLFLILACLLWRFGVKHYCSTGS